MKTVEEILKASAAFLEKKQVGRSRRLAEDLLAHIFGQKRIDLYLQYDRPLIDEELAQMRDGVKRLSQGEPLQYILGELEFYGCRIKTDRRALIPRQETELLVDLIVKRKPKGVVWDLCAGSGCIGIAPKKKIPELTVVMSDVSKDALSLAEENVKINEVDVSLRQGDLLEPLREEKADVVVCNPPYVTADEYETIDPSVRDFEPKLALVGGESGLVFYQRLQAELPFLLKKGGQLFLEIGANQGAAIKEIFSTPVWEGQELLQDWSGRDRFFFTLKSNNFLDYDGGLN